MNTIVVHGDIIHEVMMVKYTQAIADIRMDANETLAEHLVKVTEQLKKENNVPFVEVKLVVPHDTLHYTVIFAIHQ